MRSVGAGMQPLTELPMQNVPMFALMQRHRQEPPGTTLFGGADSVWRTE